MTVSQHKTIVISASLIILGAASWLHAQGGDPREILVRKLSDQFVLTRMTADGTDVVKAGSPVTLHKDGLQMCSTEAKIPLTNTYKDGKLSAAKFAWAMAMGLAQPSLPTANVPMRTFVSEEKFWITAVSVEKSAVIFKVYSDTYSDVRYYAQLSFPFDKKAPPPVEDLMRTISSVVTAEPSSQETAAAPVPASVDQPAPAQQAVAAPPPPPPPPTDALPPAPPTVSLGQTMDQVTAVMGQPRSVAKAGTKTIFSYSGLKVIFVNGKVSDVQ
jgi:hypothetical protein